VHAIRITSLEEKLACLRRGKKRKAILNPNKRFITLSEVLAAREDILKKGSEKKPVIVNDSFLEELGLELKAGLVIKVREETIAP
jgi:hypothetical protein